jgi:hypothetical protein
MILTIPDSARLPLQAALHDRVCRFFQLRNAHDRNTRRFARQSVRHFIGVLRQLEL